MRVALRVFPYVCITGQSSIYDKCMYVLGTETHEIDDTVPLITEYAQRPMSLLSTPSP